MGYLKYVREIWNKPTSESKAIQKTRLIGWRKQPVTIRIEHPTRPDRARSLGYKAKLGFVVVRQRVKRGGRQRPKIKKGRRPKHSRRKKIVKKNYQQIAEERACKNYKNCEVLNSYIAGKDGISYWYEVILIDRDHPVVLHDKNARWIAVQRGRAFRGLTSAGRKSRGLRKKGKGTEKTRPSLRANKRLH